jgi:hypothetical protein
MDPLIRKGVRKRGEWIRKNPGTAGDYIRLSKAEREKVDRLFTVDRRLQANEVTSLVERLTEERLRQRRTVNVKAQALANMRQRLGVRPSFTDSTVKANVQKMSSVEARKAAAASTDELLGLARTQDKGNLFFYH